MSSVVVLGKWPDMRPHRLELTAFGPFAEHVEIDFDRLGLGGLFLMHGETGAGKTTVLDGLSFALYGRVPGVRGVNRLRSDHASASMRTEVRLDVSIGGRRFRITRSPAQERAKQRGSGFTTEPASVSLFERDESVEGGWLPRSTRVNEVDRELSDLLGMSAEQFHQVVLLPQGQFAKFLHSDAGERATLLQRLFGTDRFRRIEDWLAEQRRQTKDTFEEARHDVRRLVARLAQVCGQPEPLDVPDPQWAVDQVSGAEMEAAEAAMSAAATAFALEQFQNAAAEAADLARRQQRLHVALRRQSALEAGAAHTQVLVSEIESARRAAAVAPALEAQARRAWRDAAAREALEAAFGKLPETLASDELRPLAIAGREALGRLAEAAELERSVARAAREISAATDGLEASRRRMAELIALQDQTPTRLAGVKTQLAEAREAAIALPTARSAADRAKEALAAAALRDARVVDVARLSAEHLAARELAVDLGQTLNELRSDRIDGMIAELAFALEDDTPCPVCGALDHPEPSEVSGRQVSRADEEKAAAAADVARERSASIGAALGSAEAARDAAAKHLLDLGRAEADVVELQAAQISCAEAVERLAVQAAAVSAAEADVTAIEAAEAARREELSRLDAAIEAQEAAGAAAKVRHLDLSERLSQMLGAAPDVASARRETQRFVELLEAAEAAAEAVRQSSAERVAADAGAAQAAADAGFESVEQARDAVRDQATLTRLEAEVTRSREEAAAVAELLADPELAVDLTVPAPVESAAEAARSALAQSRAAEQRLARATDRVKQLATLQAQLIERLRALEPIELAARRAKELADVAGGIRANRLNMQLSAYVLAARLEEVAEVASIRLRAMTQGRYTLVHSDASKGNARSGLRLLVSDAWTGQDRDTATLSGGETFLASLALALGLAEVVTASAGGAPLEALFIDEGFGTLDEETLDEVMDVLDGLREGGRLVGIVSHVAHLRDRIPSQLRVHKGTSGSSLRQTDTGEPAPAAALPAEGEPAVSAPPKKPVVINLVSEQLALLGAD